ETNILQASLWGTYCNNQGEGGDGGFGNQHVCYGCHAGNFMKYNRIPGGTPEILDSFASLSIWTTDFEDNNKDLFHPGEGIRYHLSFYLKGAMDGTEYCIQSQNSSAKNTSGGTSWDTPIVVDTLLSRGQHEMHWDKTVPIEARDNAPGTAQFSMTLTMSDSDCTEPPEYNTASDAHDFAIELQNPNDPPLPPTLTPEADTTDPSVTLEWSEVLCPDGDTVEYYVEVDNSSDFDSPEHILEWKSQTSWGPLSLSTATTWHWRVKARDSVHTDRESDWSYPDSFEVLEPSGTPPPAPTPTPEPDTNRVSVTLEWSEVTCPGGADPEYYVEVDSTLLFTSPYSSGWQAGTGWAVTLPNTSTPTTWVWRVKARDATQTNLESSWSSSDFFERNLSEGPSLHDKENVTSTVPIEVSLTWNAYGSFTNTPQYFVQVNDAADFTGPNNHTSGWLSGEEWSVTLDADTTWYWRIKARDSVDQQLESFWSDTDAFDIGPYIIEESYESSSPGYGYDQDGWGEVAEYTNCDVVEDATIPGTPPVDDFGLQCLRSEALGNIYEAYSHYSYTSPQATTYTSFWLYVASENVEHYEYKPLLVLFDASGETVLDFGLYAQWNHH
ncbi:MAG: hypothetical protein SWE60_20460, partial [Thermodesulfobacteriota bacterium]|nr:hypothetical protein [Thermodesulfobacteriota bacterium]